MLLLDPPIAQTIVEDVKHCAEQAPDTVLVTDPGTRRYLAALLQHELDIRVLSTRELLKPDGPVLAGVLGPAESGANVGPAAMQR